MYGILIQVFSFLTFWLSFLLAESSRAPLFCNKSRSYCSGPVLAASSGDLHQARNSSHLKLFPRVVRSSPGRKAPTLRFSNWSRSLAFQLLREAEGRRWEVKWRWGARLSIFNPFTYSAGGSFQNDTRNLSECLCPERNKQLRSP